METQSTVSAWLRRRGWLVLLIALLQFALHLWTNAHDNIFRDEMYYVAAGEHLDFGYVEYPPFVALAARVAQALSGVEVVVPGAARLARVGLHVEVAALLAAAPRQEALAGHGVVTVRRLAHAAMMLLAAARGRVPVVAGRADLGLGGRRDGHDDDG